MSPHRTALAAIVAILLLFCVYVADAAAPFSYNVDWASAASSANIAPRTVASTELGDCMCDLTTNACDPNCCCDTDCSESVKSSFTCVKEVHSDGKAESCFKENSATEQIRGKELERRLDRVRPGEDAVCVYRDNYPDDAIRYFEVPDSVADTDIVAPTVSDWNTPPSDLTLGQPMLHVEAVQSPVDNKWSVRETGYLTIPTSGPGGVCVDDVAVKFLSPLTQTTCFKEAETMEALCPSLTADVYALSAVALKDAVSKFEDVVTFDLHLYNATTGESISNSSSSDLFRQIFNVGGGGASARRTMDTLAIPEDVVCQNAMERSEMIIRYKSDSSPVTIVSVTVNAYVRHLVENVTRFQQQHVVMFATEKQTALPVEVSGNPGYLAGTPILAGTLVTDDNDVNAIQQRINGLSIPFGRRCSDNKFKGVKFLHDVVSSGCSVELTEEEFNNMCNDGKSEERLRAILSPTINSTFSNLYNTTVLPIDRIGKFGDSRRDVPSNWVEVASNWAEITPQRRTISRTCSNIYVGAQYVIMVARAGAEFNPQDIIVGAKLEPIIGAWSFRSSTNTDTFDYKFKVKFVRYKEGSQSTDARKVVPPAILPAMSDNVFYPFRFPGRQADDGTN